MLHCKVCGRKRHSFGSNQNRVSQCQSEVHLNLKVHWRLKGDYTLFRLLPPFLFRLYLPTGNATRTFVPSLICRFIGEKLCDDDDITSLSLNGSRLVLLLIQFTDGKNGVQIYYGYYSSFNCYFIKTVTVSVHLSV